MKFEKTDIKKIKITATIVMFLLVIILIIVFKNNSEQTLHLQDSIVESLINKNAKELKLVIRRLNIVTRRLNMLSVISEQNNLNGNKIQISNIAQEIKGIYVQLKKYQYSEADEKTTEELESEISLSNFDALEKLDQKQNQDANFSLVGDNITLASILKLDSELRDIAIEIDGINRKINLLEEKIYLANNITNIYSKIINGKKITHANPANRVTLKQLPDSIGESIPTNPIAVNQPATPVKIISVPTEVTQTPIVQKPVVVKIQAVNKPTTKTVTNKTKSTPAKITKKTTVTKNTKATKKKTTASKSTKPAKKETQVAKTNKNLKPTQVTKKNVIKPVATENNKPSEKPKIVTAKKQDLLPQQTEPTARPDYDQEREERISNFSKKYPIMSEELIENSGPIEDDVVPSNDKNNLPTEQIEPSESAIVFSPSDFLMDEPSNYESNYDDSDDEENSNYVDDDLSGF